MNVLRMIEEIKMQLLTQVSDILSRLDDVHRKIREDQDDV